MTTISTWLAILFGFVVGAVLVFWWGNERYEKALDEATKLNMANAILRMRMGDVATGADEYERAERGR